MDGRTGPNPAALSPKAAGMLGEQSGDFLGKPHGSGLSTKGNMSQRSHACERTQVCYNPYPHISRERRLLSEPDSISPPKPEAGFTADIYFSFVNFKY